MPLFFQNIFANIVIVHHQNIPLSHKQCFPPWFTDEETVTEMKCFSPNLIGSTGRTRLKIEISVFSFLFYLFGEEKNLLQGEKEKWVARA